MKKKTQCEERRRICHVCTHEGVKIKGEGAGKPAHMGRDRLDCHVSLLVLANLSWAFLNILFSFFFVLFSCHPAERYIRLRIETMTTERPRPGGSRLTMPPPTDSFAFVSLFRR